MAVSIRMCKCLLAGVGLAVLLTTLVHYHAISTIVQSNIMRREENETVLGNLNQLSGASISRNAIGIWKAVAGGQMNSAGLTDNPHQQNISWKAFQKDQTVDQLYSEEASYMDDLLDSLATTEIKSAKLLTRHSQLKLLFTLVDGNVAVAKPMRTPRDYVYPNNEQYPPWLDLERHTAEIASFHLDRVLNFRRAPPCTGRIINVTRDIQQKSTDKYLLESFSKIGNSICFTGKCSELICTKDNLVCAWKEELEISMCQYLREGDNLKTVYKLPNPWRISRHGLASWEQSNICEDFLKDKNLTETRILLDIVEQGILDYLILNYDRHSFYLTKQFDDAGFAVIIDNGKGFGNPYTDDTKLLAPTYQCCVIRNSTYQRMRVMHENPDNRLSDVMRRSLLRDQISRHAPVLSEVHLEALDRRLAIVIETVDACIKRLGPERVLVNSRHINNQ